MPEIIDAQIVKERLGKVRQIMKEHNIDVYIICTGDYHMSEYTSAYFAEREYLSGFTGSAGTLVVTADEAALFTDGRYFVQAEMQIEKTEIELMRMGCKDVPTVCEYCKSVLPENGIIGFDGRTVETADGIELSDIARTKNGKTNVMFNAVEKIWEDRPQFPATKAFEIGMEYAGESRASKIQRLRRKMDKEHANMHIIATLDDICWLLNIRGNDVECNPVIMAYMVVTKDKVMLYTQENKFSESLIQSLKEDGVLLLPYEKIYEDLKNIGNVSVLLDQSRINVALYSCIDKRAAKIIGTNPSVLMKAVKNETEIKNLKEIHIQDGLAVTRFMYWLKKNVGKQRITEADAAKYLDELRSKIDGFIELSFPTISAYGANAAMMHYSATEENCALLKPEGMLLVDSGGQYYKGTTDITRTFALGSVTDEMKKYFTLTLKGMLELADAKFLYGCDGFSLDILARKPLWEQGMDYRCGTGHGIGYLLNVHESPNGFRWKHNYGKNDLCVFEDGMVTSDEPGVYIDGQYGIRIENEILCRKDYENEYGQFMKFEMLTMVPIDLDLVDVRYLSEKDRKLLNDYHSNVYEKLSPYLINEELDFLKEYTRKV